MCKAKNEKEHNGIFKRQYGSKIVKFGKLAKASKYAQTRVTRLNIEIFKDGRKIKSTFFEGNDQQSTF